MDSYSKTYENDIFFFIPLTSLDIDRTVKELTSRNKLTSKRIEGKEVGFGNLYCDILTEHVLYECNNPTFRTLERFYLGKYLLACYDDDYDGTVHDTENVHIFVTLHRNTGLCIATLAVHDNHYIPTQLIDQMSTDHLDVSFDGGETYLPIIDIMEKTFHLSLCGDSKCVVCLSNEPEDRTELGYLLSGETFVSEHIDYHIRDKHIQKLLENRAIYDYYDSYISRSVIAFIFKEYPDDLEERLQQEASELFIVEIVLFQNTAVLRTNNRVVSELCENDGISNKEIEELYLEFGRTMVFWSTDVYKYPFSQIEADEVIKSFGIEKAMEEYRRNQSFLDRMIEIKSNISSEKSGSLMNNILYILSWIEGGSILLGGFIWLLHLLLDESSPYYSIIETATRVISLVSCFAIALLLLAFINGKLSFSKSKKNKKDKKNEK